MNSKRLIAIVVACGLAGGVLFAQTRGGGAEWPTAGGDAQRTSWIRTDAAISLQTMSKPGFDLQWKSALDNQPRGSNGLSQGVTANGVTLFVPMSVVAGSSNNVYGIDNDTGYAVWQRHFDAALPAPTTACPGGITAAPTRIAAIAPPAPPGGGRGAGGGGGGGGRASGYRGAVSEPGQGVPAELASRNGGGAGRGPAAPGAPGAATPPGGRAGAGAGANAGGAAAGTTPPDPARGSGAPPDPARGGGAAPDPARGAGAGAPAGAPGGRGGAGGGGNAGGGIPGAGGAGGGGGFGRAAGVVYVVTSDGVLHVLGLQSGKDLQKPALFLPPNAKWSDAIAVNETMYAATSQNCGGAPNGIFAIDLAAEGKPVMSWTTNGGGIVGALSFTTDGTLIAAIGPGPATPGGYSNAIIAFDAKTLHVKDWFTSPTAEFTSTPIIFTHENKDLVAATTKDGRVLLLDAASLGGADHATPLYASQAFTTASGTSALDALATWQEMLPGPSAPAATAGGAGAGAAAAPPAPAMQPGTRWLLLPVAGTLPTGGTWPLTGGAITNGAIVALKLVNQNGKLSLQPGWVSRDLTSPSTPIIVNGVVFAVSKGKPTTPAVLYAMDGANGKDLWNSGTTMTSHATGRSFWSATGQVYVGTFDGALYAFGFPMDRK